MKYIFVLVPYLLILSNGAVSFPRVDEYTEDTLTMIDRRLKELEGQVVRKAKEAKGEMETKLWGLHDELENRVKALARHLERDCRRKALKYLSDALDEVEKNGMACQFAKSLSNKMNYIEEEARSVILALRLEAQDLKLKHIPCFNHEMASPYCQKVPETLERLAQPAKPFLNKANKYFKGDYEKFLLECFDKTAFDMKVQAGIVESKKCKGA